MRSNRDIAQLGYVELFTPTFEESVRFFTDVLSMTPVKRAGDSVCLRTWDDYERFSLKLTARASAGIGRVGVRAFDDEALHRRVAQIEASGLGRGWVEGQSGRGATYAFADPDGHDWEIYFEAERYTPPEGAVPALKNQAQRRPSHGVGVRRLDHVNFLAADVEGTRDFVVPVLGALPTEQIQLDSGAIAAIWMTFSNKGYDVVYTNDWTGTPGRLHHVAFAVDQREDILRAADTFLEHGVFIETGPHKHAIQQTFFLYVWEPGGNRIEIVNAGARLVLAPDWELITWTEADRAKGQAWGLKTIESFHTHGTPPVSDPSGR
ncbi:MAG TPA: VOC family protein [Acidimicrobiia bacterium]|nr:VOC family protein [Acidimicrobiia bacterium]